MNVNAFKSKFILQRLFAVMVSASFRSADKINEAYLLFDKQKENKSLIGTQIMFSLCTF